MCKVLICADVHFCQYSSIIRGRGELYTKRLENCIASLNWVEQLAIQKECSEVFFLGDFFSKNVLCSEEITALNDIKFSKLPHYAIVGNHEISISNNAYSSLHLLNEVENFQVINKYRCIERGNVLIHLLPYIYDCPESLQDVCNFSNENKKHIVLSHNDLKGIRMGKFISVSGLDINIIDKSCDLFINGHLHNGSKISNKILNLGILTGQNFNEDAYIYEHHVALLDLDTLKVELIENPFAFNFYKVEIEKEEDINKINHLKNNSAVMIKCSEDLQEKVRNKIKNSTNIVEARVVVNRAQSSADIMNNDSADLAVNHLEKFKEFCLDKLGSGDIVLKELVEICR